MTMNTAKARVLPPRSYRASPTVGWPSHDGLGVGVRPQQSTGWLGRPCHYLLKVEGTYDTGTPRL